MEAGEIAVYHVDLGKWLSPVSGQFDSAEMMPFDLDDTRVKSIIGPVYLQQRASVVVLTSENDDLNKAVAQFNTERERKATPHLKHQWDAYYEEALRKAQADNPDAECFVLWESLSATQRDYIKENINPYVIQGFRATYVAIPRDEQILVILTGAKIVIRDHHGE